MNSEGCKVTSTDAVGLAREFKAALGGRVHAWGGEYWVWDQQGGRWTRRTTEKVKKALWRWMAGVSVVKPAQGGGTIEKPLRVDSMMVSNVVEALAAITELDMVRLPGWIGEGPGPFRDPSMVVTCEDVLIDVGASAGLGQLVMVPRGPEWLDPVVINVKMRDATSGLCNVKSREWDERMKVWGDGDKEWQELCERWMGYTLLGTRKFQRWCLQVGKSGAGKGVLTRLWKDLCGSGGFMGTGWEDLTGQFGLDGLEAARFLVVAEGGEEVEKSFRGRMGSVLKQLIGQDTFTVNKKYGARIGGVVSQAAVMVQANATPRLDDAAHSITSKMLVLPYRVGHRGKEDLGIGERLAAQGAGVIMAWLGGAMRLVQATEEARWPSLDDCGDVAEEMRGRESAVDRFLEDRFVRAEGGWVAGEMIRKIRHEWEMDTRVSLEVDDKFLIGKLEREGRWALKRSQQSGGGPRGLKGLLVKARS